jgi:hypothetical protein
VRGQALQSLYRQYLRVDNAASTKSVTRMTAKARPRPNTGDDREKFLGLEPIAQCFDHDRL